MRWNMIVLASCLVTAGCAGSSMAERQDADIQSLGGTGGLIAVAPDGDAAWGFTTPAMYRGMADAGGRTVAIYADEEER